MSTLRQTKKNWDLTKDAFDLLLLALGPHRERAGEKYELLRWKLVKFFSWQASVHPSEAADEVLNVTARKLSEGEQIRNVSAYCLAIARNLLIEEARERGRESIALHNPLALSFAEHSMDRENLLECLEQSMEELPADDRKLLTIYYSAEKRAKIEARQALTRELGIPLNALRIRACRLRAKLEQAINRRIQERTKK